MPNSNVSKNKGKLFLKTFCFSFFFIALIISIFNFIVNPFDIFNTPLINAFINKVKPCAYDNARLIRAHKLCQIKPRGLILGASRAEIGFSPNHPGWRQGARPVYNSALPSGRIFECYQYLLHAQSQNDLSQVVLGLDFFSFDISRLYEKGFISERLDTNKNKNINLTRLKDFVTILLSFDAISNSIKTIRNQNYLKSGYLYNGRLDTSHYPELISRSGGYFGAFNKRLKSTIISKDGIVGIKYGLASGESKITLEWFRKLVKFCISESIELYILISPVHSSWLELMFQLGRWDEYEQWKVDILKIVDSEAGNNKGIGKVELWDFSGFNSISMERIPMTENVKGKMRWYWEASHFKKELGDLMLDRVLIGIQGESPNDFGFQLSQKNIVAHLQQLRKDHLGYTQKRPDEVRYLKRLIHDNLVRNAE